MAHQPTESTARLPDGHPIHPILIPFPIAFLTGALVTDLVFAFGGSDFWASMSLWLVGAGLVTGVLAAVAGTIDFATIPKARHHRAGWMHFLGNAAVLGIAGGSLAGRVLDVDGFVLPWGLALSAVTGVLLAWTGYLGGELSYRHQIGVIPEHEEEPAARERRQVRTGT